MLNMIYIANKLYRINYVFVLIFTLSIFHSIEISSLVKIHHFMFLISSNNWNHLDPKSINKTLHGSLSCRLVLLV